jgi:hypothetical protein
MSPELSIGRRQKQFFTALVVSTGHALYTYPSSPLYNRRLLLCSTLTVPTSGDDDHLSHLTIQCFDDVHYLELFINQKLLWHSSSPTHHDGN